MRITLAWHHDGHGPDETIEVADAVGRQLLRDGFARPPDSDDLDGRTVAQLREYAAGQAIDLAGAKKKPQIVAAIRAAEKARTSPITTLAPAGDETQGGPRGR